MGEPSLYCCCLARTPPMDPTEIKPVAQPAAAAQSLDWAVLSEMREMQDEDEPDILQHMLRILRADTPPLLEAMAEALASGQPERLKQAAHKLRGGCIGMP